MPGYRLVSFKGCPWVQRVAIVLREKAIDFEFQHIEPGNRPDWFRSISPHNKVPVLRIDDTTALFESGAICEYLDETHAPRLHPNDPIERAVNRAWIEYMPTFMNVVSAHAYAMSEADYVKAAAQIPAAFEKLEQALGTQHAKSGDGGPFFNGARYSLVDASYAPFLQRHLFLERIRKLGHIDGFPRVRAWAEAIVARRTTHSFPPAEYEAMYRDTVRRRAAWISQFVDDPKAAAE
ncbi:MAG TPA: glutathione S-transferase family protein [Dongiaceae bacterium]|jgi:glutathione S-transferase|nr:glutathione S-transferase family protein [Dongiaceae bacterium]